MHFPSLIAFAFTLLAAKTTFALPLRARAPSLFANVNFDANGNVVADTSANNDLVSDGDTTSSVSGSLDASLLPDDAETILILALLVLYHLLCKYNSFFFLLRELIYLFN